MPEVDPKAIDVLCRTLNIASPPDVSAVQRALCDIQRDGGFAPDMPLLASIAVEHRALALAVFNASTLCGTQGAQYHGNVSPQLGAHLRSKGAQRSPGQASKLAEHNSTQRFERE